MAQVPSIAVLSTGVLLGVASALASCLPSYTFSDGAAEAGSTDTGTDGPRKGRDATRDGPSRDGQAHDGTVKPGRDGGQDSEASADATADAANDGAVEAGPDGTPDGFVPEAAAEAGFDVGPPAEGGPFVVSTTTHEVTAGFGEQTHLIYARNAQVFWLFYADTVEGVGTIKATSSPNLAHWSPAIDVTGTSTLLNYGLGGVDGGGGGSSFSVAYVQRGTTDIIHLVANATNGGETLSIHTRGIASATNIDFATPVPLPDTNSDGPQDNGSATCPMDGPSVAVTDDGRVYDVTAWTGHQHRSHDGGSSTCDTNVYLASGVEDGGAQWDASFGHDGYYVAELEFAYSHGIVPDVGDAQALLVFPDRDENPPQIATEFGWATSNQFILGSGDGGTYGTVEDPGSELFSNEVGSFSYDDWAICRLGRNDVRLVRHLLRDGGTVTDGFQELRFDGNTWSEDVATPNADLGATNSGLVLLSGPSANNGMLLATISSNSDIEVQQWIPGDGGTGSWVQRTTIPAPVGATRTGLAGSGCGSVARALVWSEQDGSDAAPSHRLVVADLSSYLQ